MASEVTNQQAITFCDEEVRIIAQTALKFYQECLTIQNTWNAQGLSSIIPNTSELIADEAVTVPDGRPQITGANVTNVITQAEAIVTSFQANSNAILNVWLAIAAYGAGGSQPSF